MNKAGSRVNIIILDACRNNPFRGFFRSQDGLAAMPAPDGTIISYATALGKKASDGTGGAIKLAPIKPIVQIVLVVIVLNTLAFSSSSKRICQSDNNSAMPFRRFSKLLMTRSSNK